MKTTTRKKIAEAAAAIMIAASVAGFPVPAQASGGGAEVIIQLPGTATCLTAQQKRYPDTWPVTLETCQESRAATWVITDIGNEPGGVVLRSLATGRYLGQSTANPHTPVQQEIPVRLDYSTITSDGKTLWIFDLGIPRTKGTLRLSAWFFEGAPPGIRKGWRVDWETAEEDPVSGLQVWNVIHSG